MSRRGGHSSANGIQLLPFLDILTCTMAALVTLLFAFARFGQQQVVQVTDAKQAAAEAAAAAEIEDLEWRSSVLRDSRDKTEADLGNARLELSHLEDHLRRLRERAEQIHQAAIALENADPKATQVQAGAELSKLKERITLTKRELELAKQNAAGKPTTYSIVPYAGPNQTRRRPIYLECRAEGVVLEPEGIVFTDSDFAGPLGPSNPLAAAVRAAREYMAASDPNAFEQVEPYPLLVVRPDAIPQYYAARSALISFGSQFGYELIGADKKLKFPDPDPKMAEVITNVVAEARIRQEQLIAAAPKHYRKPKTFHVKPGGGGIEQEPGSRTAQDDRNPYRGLGGRGGGGGGKGTWGNSKGNGGNGGNGNGAGGTTTGTTTGTTVGTTTGTGDGNGNGGLYGGGGGNGFIGGNGAGGVGQNGTGGGDPLGNGNLADGGGRGGYGTGAGGPVGYGNGAAGQGGYGTGNGPNGPGTAGGTPGGYPPGGGGGYGQGGMPAGGQGGGLAQNTPPGAGGPGTPGSAYGSGKAPGAGGPGTTGGQGGLGRAGGVPGTGLSALADNGKGAAGSGGPGDGQTGAEASDDTEGGVGQGDTDGNGGDGTNGNSPGMPGQVGSGGGGSSGGRLARGGQAQPGSNDAPGGTPSTSGTPQTTTLQGTGGSTAGNTNGTGSGTGPGGGGLGGLGGKALGNAADTTPNGTQKPSRNGGAAVPQGRAEQATNANAWNVGGGADDTGPSNNSNPTGTSPTPGGSSASGRSTKSSTAGSGGGSTNSSQSSSSQSSTNQASGGMSGSSGPQSGQQGGVGMPNLNIGQQPQDPAQTGRHGKKNGGQRPPGWGLPDAPDTSASVARPVVVECWSDKLAIIDEDGKSIVKQIPLGQHTEDSVDELVSSVLQQTKLWGVAGKGLHWRPTLTIRVAPEARARFEELKTALADSGLDVKESTHKPSIARKPGNPLRK